MGAHLRNGKDISRKEKLRAEIARQNQYPPRRGDVPIYYEHSESAVKRSRLLQQRSFDRTAGSSFRPGPHHGAGRSVQSEQHAATRQRDQPFLGQLPGGFPSSRVKPIDASACSNQATGSFEKSSAINPIRPTTHPSSPEELHPPKPSPSD